MSSTRDTPIAADGGLGLNCLDFSFSLERQKLAQNDKQMPLMILERSTARRLGQAGVDESVLCLLVG